ncbi:MAG: NlpC/P60 family protein [Lachnospira sp.]
MKKRVIKTVVAVAMVACMAATTVFADDIDSLKGQKEQTTNELEQKKSELASLISQINTLESDMAELQVEITKTNEELAEQEANLAQQYEEMKLRIKYIYEDQGSSISDAFVSSGNMSEVLNKVEYIQQIYDYDRTKLSEIAETTANIKAIKESLEEKQQELTETQTTLLSKQSSLYKTMDELETKIDNLDEEIAEAVRKAAEEEARRQAMNNSNNYYYVPTQANNDSAVASAVVSLAYSYLGVPYVSGGTSPSGFDCSGLIYYCFAQQGITIPRTSGGMFSYGMEVSLADAQPGDIICYPGHVGIYIGDGMMVHSTVPGSTVKTGSIYSVGKSIIGVRRYW